MSTIDDHLSDRQGNLLPVKRLTAADLVSVHNLECQAHSHPMSQSMLASLIERHCGWGLFADDGHGCLGFCLTSLVVDESELLDIAIAPSQQGRGLGESLLRFAISRLPQQVQGMFLEVRVSNESAIALYDKLGFIETGIRKGYYPAAKGREDAQLMALDLAMLTDPEPAP